MRRVLALVGLVSVVTGGVLLIEHASASRTYSRLLETGQRALDVGDSYAAIEAFTGALTLRPSSMVAHYHRGEAYRAERREEEAIRDFREALRLAPNAPQPLVALGDLYGNRAPAQAASWYGEAVARINSDDPVLLYKLALARYRAGLPAEAVAPLQHALARNDSLAEAHYLLGLVYRDLQRLDDATASLERAVKLAPGLVPAREELADVYHARGRFLDETTQLEALETLDHGTARAVRMGLVQAGQGQYAAAVETLRAASLRVPGDSRVQLALGRVYLLRAERTGNHGDLLTARAVLEQALGGAAPRSEGLALFGRALALAGDGRAADRILHDAAATSPVDPEAFAFLADTAEQLGHFVDARDALLDLDGLEGDTTSTADRTARAERIGRLSLRAGDLPSALRYLTQAVAAGRQDPQTLALLAEARLQSGDRPGATDARARPASDR